MEDLDLSVAQDLEDVYPSFGAHDCLSMEESSQEETKKLFLIMSSNNEKRFSLYRICEPRTVLDIGDEMTVKNLEEPLFEMDKSVFSDAVSFAAVGSRIFMVGGFSYDDKQEVQASKDVFIFDTKTSELSRGPSLSYGKMSPHLFTLGSKLFALSDALYSDDRNSSPPKREILFEVLDTSKLECGWCPLPIPTLNVSKNRLRPKYMVSAFVPMILDGGSSVVFLSVGQCGTYVFDVAKEMWDFVSNKALPFAGHGSTIPHTRSLCCGISIKTRKFCSFRFTYNGDEDKMTNRLQIHETSIQDPFSFSPPLPPFLFARPTKMVQGPGGRFYFVGSGVDKPNVTNTLDGNRYVKISAYEFSNLKVDEDEVQKLKKCKTIRPKEEAVTQVKLTGLWRSSYFGGPVCDPLLHVKAAFAM